MKLLSNPRAQRALVEFVGFVLLGQLIKSVLDVVIWQYAGPITLLIMLSVIGLYMRSRGELPSSIGLVRLSSRKNYLLIAPQIALAFLAIIASGAVVTLVGEASSLEFMKPDHSGARARFGDLEGNTSLYFFWLAILWFAGPAEELYFRGFMIEKLQKALGKSRLSIALSVFIPAAIFGFGHMYYQGLRGFFTTGTIALTLGILFLLYKRNIWPLMIAHAAVNTLIFTLQYLGLEA